MGSSHTYSPSKKQIRDNTEKCFYCRHNLKKNGKYSRTFDHVTPVSKGGTSSAENLVVACRRCNNLKADMTIHDTVGKINGRLRFATDRKEVKELEFLKRSFLRAGRLMKRKGHK